jgi:spermidine synthase
MNRPRFKISLVLTFASGAAALAHETLWTRRLVDVLGASAETFSKVVGAFFLGLALGAWLASGKRISTRAGWAGVAGAELAVGLLAIPVLLSATWSQGLFSCAALVPWLKLLVPIALVVPPAMAMGAVLPWLLEALSLQEKQSVNFAVWIYAVNTLGGIAGIAVVLLAPVPELGLTRMGLLVSGLNVVIAAAASLMQFSGKAGSRRAAGVSLAKRPAPADAGCSVSARWLAFASGFLVLSLEVLLQHQLAQVTVNSQFSSGTVLGLVLLALALATAVLPALVRRLGETGALPAALLAAAGLCAAEPLLLTWMRDGVSFLPLDLTVLPYTLAVLKLGVLAVCPAVAAAGLVFPLLLRGQSGNSGRRVGQLLAWNGLGGWLGTEFTQGFLAPEFGLWTGVEIIAAAYLALWGIFEWRRTAGASRGASPGAASRNPTIALIACGAGSCPLGRPSFAAGDGGKR